MAIEIELEGTDTKSLFRMITVTGREFGIRKSSYKKLLDSGQINQKTYDDNIAVMEQTYFLLKKLYENSSNLQPIKISK